jgi:hypothetical protein
VCLCFVFRSKKKGIEGEKRMSEKDGERKTTGNEGREKEKRFIISRDHMRASPH